MLWLNLILACVSLGAVGFVAWLARKKHRYLFQLHTAEMRRLRQEIQRLERKTRLNELRLGRPSLKPQLPVRFESQFGEDAVLFDFFKDQPQGFYIEAGAHNGITLSNTYFFESIGWTGLLVEAHPEAFKKCKENRPGSDVVHAALASTSEGSIRLQCRSKESADLLAMAVDDRKNGSNGHFDFVEVPKRSLNDLLKDHTGPIDFLSLDVEGMELEALDGFDLERFAPRLLLIESNSEAERVAVQDYVERRGYIPGIQRGPNTFYFLESPEAQAFIELVNRDLWSGQPGPSRLYAS